ncbi:MAG: DNA-directed RNA polymerase subunit K [Candidatus Micrarchaeota archaeon]
MTAFQDLNKYEKARLLGARALQLASGAPPLVEIEGGVLNPIKISFEEFQRGVIPLVVIHE